MARSIKNRPAMSASAPRRSKVPDQKHESEAKKQGWRFVVGIDEAGRGPLAGPVVAGAVHLPARFRCPGLNDSKKLSPTQRDHLYEQLTTDRRVMWAVAVVEASEIDELNILVATHTAMRRAVAALAIPPDFALIDGLPVPDFPLPQLALVQGDSISMSIAAASILAKVTRDRLMRAHALTWPGYAFDRHKGYGTAVHLDALHRLGPCPIHRRSFAPVREAGTAEASGPRGPRPSGKQTTR